MKNTLSISLVIATFAIFACNKEEDKMILPKIEFKTGAGYTSNDTTTFQKDTLLVGIIAVKTEENDVLKTFNVSVSYDGGTATSVYNQILTASEGDNFSTDYNIITRDEPGSEKWVYTITNRDGLINSVSLIVTVK